MTEKTNNSKETIFIAITLILMIGFGFLPPVLDLNQNGMRILGILFGVIFGCSFCSSVAWVCLLSLVMLAATGVSNASTIFATGLGNDSIWLMTFFFVFVAILDEAQIVDVLAKRIISVKFVQGRPWVYTFILMFGTYLIGATGLSFPAMIIFWNILIKTCKEFGIKPYSPYPAVAFTGIAFAGLGASCLWLFTGNPLFINAMLTNISGGMYSFNFAGYAIFSGGLWTTLIIVYIMVFKFIKPVDVSLLKGIKASGEEVEKLTKRQKALLIYTALVLVLYCGKGFVPAATPLGAWVAGIGSSVPIMLLLALMCITKVDGEYLCNFARSAKNGVVWDTVILSASLLSIATIMMSTDTGVQATLLRLLNPIFAGHGVIFMTVVICVISVILTNFMANTTVGLMFTPVIYSLSQTMGFNPMPVIGLLLIAITIAYMTPAASPFASMLFGYSAEWVKKGDLYKYGLISCIIITLMMLLVGIPFSKLIF